MFFLLITCALLFFHLSLLWSLYCRHLEMSPLRLWTRLDNLGSPTFQGTTIYYVHRHTRCNNYKYWLKFLVNSDMHHLLCIKDLKKCRKKWFDPLLISHIKRSMKMWLLMHIDTNAPNGSKNFQEHLGHFISGQNHFQNVRLIHINLCTIGWYEVIGKKDLSKPLHFFLSKTLLLLSKLLSFYRTHFYLVSSEIFLFIGPRSTFIKWKVQVINSAISC